MPFRRGMTGFSGRSDQVTDRRVFFLDTFGAVFVKEVATALGDNLAFAEASVFATEVLLLSEITEAGKGARGGFDGFFFVTSS